jgi:hypothetical protein
VRIAAVHRKNRAELPLPQKEFMDVQLQAVKPQC